MGKFDTGFPVLGQVSFAPGQGLALEGAWRSLVMCTAKPPGGLSSTLATARRKDTTSYGDKQMRADKHCLAESPTADTCRARMMRTTRYGLRDRLYPHACPRTIGVGTCARLVCHCAGFLTFCVSGAPAQNNYFSVPSRPTNQTDRCKWRKLCTKF